MLSYLETTAEYGNKMAFGQIQTMVNGGKKGSSVSQFRCNIKQNWKFKGEKQTGVKDSDSFQLELKMFWVKRKPRGSSCTGKGDHGDCCLTHGNGDECAVTKQGHPTHPSIQFFTLLFCLCSYWKLETRRSNTGKSNPANLMSSDYKEQFTGQREISLLRWVYQSLLRLQIPSQWPFLNFKYLPQVPCARSSVTETFPHGSTTPTNLSDALQSGDNLLFFLIAF